MKESYFGNNFLNEKSTKVVAGKEGRNYALTDEEKEQICLLYEKDYSLREIAKCYSVSHETIRRTIKAKKVELSLVQKEIIRQRKKQGFSLEQIRKGLAVNDDEFITLKTIRDFLEFELQKEQEEKEKNVQKVKEPVREIVKDEPNENRQMKMWEVQEKSNIFGTQISPDFRVKDDVPQISNNPLE